MNTLRLAVALLALTACAPAPSSAVCDAGTRATCTCETDSGSRTTGFRVCADDGARYGACQCGEVCGFENARACTCVDGSRGAQFCDAPGEVWGPCECNADAGR